MEVNMKIALVMPPFPPNRRFPPGNHPRLFPPLGLGYIAAVLENNGFEVSIHDLYRLKWESIYTCLGSDRFDILGISAIFPSRISMFLLIDLIHKIKPQAQIIIGGPYATVMAEELAAHPFVKAVVIGEGEETFLELAKALREHRDIGGIKGLAYKRDDRVIITEPRKRIENLDELPFPAFHLYDLKSYVRTWPGNLSLLKRAVNHTIKGKRWAPIITTRSCSGNCHYCAIPLTSGEARSRSGKNVVEEIEFLNKEYGYDHIFFQDASFPIGSSLQKEICTRLIDRDIRVQWATNTGASKATLENLQHMRRAGCCYLLFGVESGSESVLQKINKKETLQQTIDAILLSNKLGIMVGIHIIVGAYGENENTIKETIALIKKMRKYITHLHVRLLCIFPGTGLYNDLLSGGMIMKKNFLNDSDEFFIPYTIEHDISTLLKWKRKILSASESLF
jgi:radical SAM superfamily enzyme YgiQ (UPF0313 family)